MRYLDTSLLVAALPHETMTRSSQRWLATRQAGSIAISDWVVAEFSDTQSTKLREKRLGAAARAEALSAFAWLAEESLEVWPVTRADFRTAARFADQHVSALRARDVLRLAISAEPDAPICTLDRAMIAAARTLKVSAAPPA